MDEIRLRTISLCSLWSSSLQSLPSFSKATQERCYVLDTNILLDLVYWNDAHVRALFEALTRGEAFALFDEETLFEFALVLDCKNFSLTKEKKEALFRQALSWGSLATRPSESAPTRCKDTDDQKFLNLAFCYKVPLISKDKLVLKAGKKLKKYGVTVRLP